MPFETPGTTEKKPFEMAPRANRYRAEDGTFLPSVTQILGIIAKPELMAWANGLGFKGLRYKDHLNSLAAAGTLTHAHIEADLLGKGTADESGYSDEEKRGAFAAKFHWNSWRKQYDMGRVLVERALVSEVHRYGGTIDAVIELNGQPVLLDWKTSKDIYLTHAIQVSAYQHLIRECWGQNLTAAVVSVPRIGGGFKEVRLEPDDCERLFGLFLAAKTLYERVQVAEKQWKNGLV